VRCPESLEPEFQSRDLRKKVDAWNSWLGPAVPSEKSRSQDRFWRETRPRVPIEQGPVANNESWKVTGCWDRRCRRASKRQQPWVAERVQGTGSE